MSLLSDLKPNPKNPRILKDEGFKRLKKKIQEFPQMLEKRPIVYDENMIVLGGNQRLRVLQDLANEGFEIKDEYFKSAVGWSEEDKRKFVILDNISDGEWDYEMLGNEWSDLPLEEWGLDPTKWDTGEAVEDEAPEVSDEPAVSQPGEVYQLGRHRLMCGDSTKIEDVEKLMNGQKADMVFTDPPYGVNYEGKTKDKLKIDNDTNTDVFADVLINYAQVAKLGAAFYVCCPAGNNFKDFLLPFEQECHISSTIIWVKNSMVLGHGDYHYQHEPILYGWLKNGTHQFYGDRTQTTVWNIDRPTRSKEHPTMKPIALVAKAISNSSKQDDIVLDLFGGSGSTLIACEQTNRTCFMSELDPKYVDVIRKRYAKFIGKEDEWQEITPKV